VQARLDILTENAGEHVRRAQARELAANVVQAVFRLVKHSTLHAIDNQAVVRQVEETVQIINDYGQRTGQNVSILFAHGSIFVGGQLLKANRGIYEGAMELGEVLQRFGLAELAIARDVGAQDLYQFVTAIGDAQRGQRGQLERPSPRVRLRAVSPAALKRGLTVEQLDPTAAIVRTYASAIVIMRRFYEDLLKGHYDLPQRVKRVAQSLVDLSTGETSAFLGVTAARNANHDDAGKAVNAAILAVSIARQMTDDVVSLVRIAMAALLYDIARPRLTGIVGSQRVLLIPRLSEQQETEVPAATAVVLTALGHVNEPSVMRTVIAYESHWVARAARLGPLYGGLRQATLQARIVAIARAFNDLLTPAPGMEPMSADDALMELERSWIDPADKSVIRLLVSALGIFPTGTLVELNTAEVGLVISTPNHPAHYCQPRVRVLFDQNGAPLQRPFEVDLANQPPGHERNIRRVVAGADEASRAQAKAQLPGAAPRQPATSHDHTPISHLSAPSSPSSPSAKSSAFTPLSGVNSRQPVHPGEPVAPPVGHPPQGGYPPQANYPPQAGYPQQASHPPYPQHGAYAPPVQGPSAPPGYPPAHAAAPHADPGYAGHPHGYPPAPEGYPPANAEGGYPPHLAPSPLPPKPAPGQVGYDQAIPGAPGWTPEPAYPSHLAPSPLPSKPDAALAPPYAGPIPQAPPPPSDEEGATRAVDQEQLLHAIRRSQAEELPAAPVAAPADADEPQAQKALEPTAEGTLTRTPLVHLLIYMLDQQLTGTTVFRTPEGQSHMVYFERGVPCKVRTGGMVAPLDRVLIEMGHLDEATLRESLMEIVKKKILHGRHLVQKGLLDGQTIMNALKVQIIGKLIYLFEMPPETAYAYYEAVNLLHDYGGPELTPCEPLSLIMTGVRLRGNDPLVDATLKRLGKRRLGLHIEAEMKRFELKRDEAAVVDLMRTKRMSLDELLNAGVAHERTVRMTVYALAVTRHLDLGSGGKSPVGTRLKRQTSDVQERAEAPRRSASGEISTGDSGSREAKRGLGIDFSQGARPRAPTPAPSNPESGQRAAPEARAPIAPPVQPEAAHYAPSPYAPAPPAPAPPPPYAPAPPAPAPPPPYAPAPPAPAPPPPYAPPPHAPAQHAHSQQESSPQAAAPPDYGSQAQYAPPPPPVPYAPAVSQAAAPYVPPAPAQASTPPRQAAPPAPPQAPPPPQARPPQAPPPQAAPRQGGSQAAASSQGADRRAEIQERAASIDSQDYFQMLGLDHKAGPDEVQAAYFKLAKSWHPDRLPPDLQDLKPLVSKIFTRFNEAYATLNDAKHRSDYLRVVDGGGGTPDDQAEVARVVDAALEFQKAEVLLKKHDMAGAEALARKAADADPEQPEYLTLLTWIQAQRRGEPPPLPEGRTSTFYDDLIQVFDQVIQREPQYERALFYRGMLLKRSGKIDKAIRDFRMVAQVNPKNIDAVREVRLAEMRRREDKKGKDEGGGLLGKLFKK
jgi:tetratricopeptide (TPR) repeat protein